MTTWIAIAVLFAANAGQPARKLPKPRPASALLGQPPGADVTLNVSPAIITFTANDPDLGAAAGSSTATLSWDYNGNHKVPWMVAVQAAAGTFNGCPTIPVSAVTVTCNSVDVTKNGQGTCSAPTGLSTTAQTIASGTESNPNARYTIVLSFTLSDDWHRIAQLTPSCSLTLIYTATVP